MEISFGGGKTDQGPGVVIELDPSDIVLAIHAYLTAHDVHIKGPSILRINGQTIKEGWLYIDPSGRAIVKGEGWNGGGYMD